MPSSRPSPLPDDNRLIIIANPAAGAAAGRASRARLLEAARHDFERHGISVELSVEPNSEAVSDRAEQAVLSGFSRIVAAGGDGTVNAVVNGMMRLAKSKANSEKANSEKAYGGDAVLKNVALGVLPFGTGNVFAFNLGIGKTWREACRIIRAGKVRQIDVGLAHSFPQPKGQSHRSRAIKHRHFLLMAGIGFDAKVVEDTSLRLKYLLRDFAYVLKTLQNVVQHEGTQMTLELEDGRVYANESWLVMVGNAASYAWDIKVTTHARLDDGLLDVCLMPFENKLVSIQQAMQILMGQHIERGIAEYWKVKSVHVTSEPAVPVQLDGDEWSQTPVELTVLPGVLNVLAPPEKPSESKPSELMSTP
ncbi:MAG TPA: diacylglycerol kinase family protein [Abditibacteriaceae bacterium]|nr:diacylglycerol kinase family protein [Abditibacteriaceae bacterium]